MNKDSIDLPDIITLEEYGGDYHEYQEALYSIFTRDFLTHKTSFRGEQLAIKRHPLVLNKEYTFYHMTHKGDVEYERIPDMLRCERLPWARPTIENCDSWSLKVWPQIRHGKNRLCIWLDIDDEFDYFVIIDIRAKYKLLWTAFIADNPHEIRKKEREYDEYIKSKSRPT